MSVEDSYIMRKVKGFKVGDTFNLNTEDEAHEQASFLERWGFSVNVKGTCVTIMVSGWDV